MARIFQNEAHRFSDNLQAKPEKLPADHYILAIILSAQRNPRVFSEISLLRKTGDKRYFRAFYRFRSFCGKKFSFPELLAMYLVASKNPENKCMDRAYFAGKVYFYIHDYPLAEQEFKEADFWASTAPPTYSSLSSRLEPVIWLSRVYVRQKKLKQSLEILGKVNKELTNALSNTTKSELTDLFGMMLTALYDRSYQNIFWIEEGELLPHEVFLLPGRKELERLEQDLNIKLMNLFLLINKGKFKEASLQAEDVIKEIKRKGKETIRERKEERGN